MKQKNVQLAPSPAKMSEVKNKPPRPPLPDKNTPLLRTVGFEVASAPAATSTANGDADAATANDSTVAAAAPAQEKRVKTYITDYDIKETVGEGSFGAVSSDAKCAYTVVGGVATVPRHSLFIRFFINQTRNYLLSHFLLVNILVKF